MEGVKTFDAFPKVQKHYRTKSSRGGIATIVLVFIVLWIAWDEIGSYFEGVEEHHFSIDGDIARDMQINLDIIIAMPCSAMHVNVRDATEDRVLATELLRKENVRFDAGGAHELDAAGEAVQRQDVHQALHARKSKFKRIKSTGQDGPACRVYGSMDVNRIQGDLHLTVRGHGYWDPNTQHVDHSNINFSHVVNELSFGDFYPKLINPLDGVVARTDTAFHCFQYFLSIVPTTYISSTSGRRITTNQYAVTEQSREAIAGMTPGIFFKYDLEPVSVTVTDSRTPFLQVFIRLTNIIGGVAVCMSFGYKGFDALFTPRHSRAVGMLNGEPGEDYQE